MEDEEKEAGEMNGGSRRRRGIEAERKMGGDEKESTLVLTYKS